MTLVGSTISHYKLLDTLGEGGMGDVYRAEDVRLGRQVALKLLRFGARLDDEARARMLTEARALAALDHPHICVLYEFGGADAQPFLAMQLVEGESLRTALRRGPLSEARTREVVSAVGAALSAAHARGVLHRDVKPDNVLLGTDGGIKLSDFGIARLVSEGAVTQASSVVGSPGAMAPERLSGGEATAASDQFSLGVLAYECLTGQRAFEGDSITAIALATATTEPMPPSRRTPGIDSRWDEVVRRAMAKNPAERYPSVAAFVGALPGADSSTRSMTATMAAPAAAPKGSVAVLYFENLSSDAESEYFCAGITEDILTDLSRIEGLQVPSRNAVARYRGKPVEIAQVARELNVATVLEGSVRKAGSRVRITAQLIDPANGYHLWADRYDRTLDDVFAVQEDIARSIAGALRGELSPQEISALHEDKPVSARAYDLQLRAQSCYGRYDRAAMYEALDLLQHAVALDPEYATAWSGIANACGQFLQWSWDPERPWYERGLAAAEHAIELAPDRPDGYKARAVLEDSTGNFPEALALNRKAIELDPKFLPALVNAALGERTEGDLAASERLLRRAIAVDPTHGHPHFHLASGLLMTRRPADALAAAADTLRVAQAQVQRDGAHLFAGMAHLFLDDREAADAEFAAIEDYARAERIFPAGTTLRHAIAGRHAEARSAVEDFIRHPHETGFDEFVFGSVALLIGDPELMARSQEAYHSGQRAAREWPAVWRTWSLLEPYLDEPVIREWLGDRGRRLVWPAEAPALPPKVAAQFTDLRFASGLPVGDYTR